MIWRIFFCTGEKIISRALIFFFEKIVAMEEEALDHSLDGQYWLVDSQQPRIRTKRAFSELANDSDDDKEFIPKKSMF